MADKASQERLSALLAALRPPLTPVRASAAAARHPCAADAAAFRQRVASFRIATWFAKPPALSPLQCARYGWRNTAVDELTCVSCGAVASVPASSSTSTTSSDTASATASTASETEADGAATLLVSAHRAPCRWRFCPTPLAVALPAPRTAADMRAALAELRAAAPQGLLARLPLATRFLEAHAHDTCLAAALASPRLGGAGDAGEEEEDGSGGGSAWPLGAEETMLRVLMLYGWAVVPAGDEGDEEKRREAARRSVAMTPGTQSAAAAARSVDLRCELCQRRVSPFLVLMAHRHALEAARREREEEEEKEKKMALEERLCKAHAEDAAEKEQEAEKDDAAEKEQHDEEEQHNEEEQHEEAKEEALHTEDAKGLFCGVSIESSGFGGALDEKSTASEGEKEHEEHEEDEEDNEKDEENDERSGHDEESEDEHSDRQDDSDDNNGDGDEDDGEEHEDSGEENEGDEEDEESDDKDEDENEDEDDSGEEDEEEDEYTDDEERENRKGASMEEAICLDDSDEEEGAGGQERDEEDQDSMDDDEDTNEQSRDSESDDATEERDHNDRCEEEDGHSSEEDERDEGENGEKDEDSGDEEEHGEQPAKRQRTEEAVAEPHAEGAAEGAAEPAEPEVPLHDERRYEEPDAELEEPAAAPVPDPAPAAPAPTEAPAPVPPASPFVSAVQLRSCAGFDPEADHRWFCPVVRGFDAAHEALAQQAVAVLTPPATADTASSLSLDSLAALWAMLSHHG